MIAGSRFVVHDPAAQKGKWHEVFGNDHPIHIEIGMGKGRFMMDLAAANPGIDYVGIEKYSTVLLRAVQKMEMQELANLRLVRMEAEELCEVFDRGEIALEEIGPAGWKLEAVTRDLHHDAQMLPGNIMTEYEEKFSSLGNPIYKYIIYR